MAKYRITVERDGCLADTICTAICSENWYMADDGKASFRSGEIDEKDYECNREASLSCPTGIIRITKIGEG